MNENDHSVKVSKKSYQRILEEKSRTKLSIKTIIDMAIDLLVPEKKKTKR